MGKAEREKGNRVELKLVHLLRGLGLDAERVPMSGSAGGSFVGDIRILLPHPETAEQDGWLLVVEAKSSRKGYGFGSIEKWIQDRDILVLKRDRQEPMVVLPWRIFAQIVQCLLRFSSVAARSGESD